MDEHWQEAARTRIEAAWRAGDALHLWNTLRNPDNTVSRQHLRTLCPEAPPAKAAIKVWRAFLTTRFSHLETLLADRAAAVATKDQARRDTWQREGLHTTATNGPCWQHQGTIYPHALAFVEHLRSVGYTPETTGIGTVLFRKDGGWQCGPMRNKHLNAALAYLALTAPQETPNG